MTVESALSFTCTCCANENRKGRIDVVASHSEPKSNGSPRPWVVEFGIVSFPGTIVNVSRKLDFQINQPRSEGGRSAYEVL
jgi:hypothetical protein